ncbi:unnamed protein product [Cylicocyclus nassatus]|uniref:Uncharacterized protein n=1 Tax=Cylicocyclus nassatus TaxID=53992 RepID=A0AA36H7J2_CYLNA|nr:unnamed protein product [Cylicocyclus nassatus]
MLRKRSTSVSPRELLAKFFDKADFIVGKSVRYAVTLLVGVTTVAIIIAIVSLTRSKSSGETANTPNTNFVTMTTIITATAGSARTNGTTTTSTISTKRSAKPITTTSATTYGRNTTKSTTTTKRPKPPGSFDIHCAFAADSENFKETQTPELDRQKKLMKDLGKKVIDTSSSSSAGLWAYGNVNKAKKFGDVFDDMVADFSKFCMKAEDILNSGDYRSPPGGENVIDHINNAIDKNNTANCLLFLTGSKEEKPAWKIDPVYNYTRIVIISLQGADFTNNVNITRGFSRNVDLEHFNESDIQAVYDEIIRGFKRSWTYTYLNEYIEYQYV